MTLTVRLDSEDEKRLQQIVEALQASNQSDVIRQIIYEKWNSLRNDKTFVERRGGHPQNLIHSGESFSSRESRKAQIMKITEKKALDRKRPESK